MEFITNEQLNNIILTALEIENINYIFARNVFQETRMFECYKTTKGFEKYRVMLKTKFLIKKNEYRYLYYIFDLLHNLPSLIRNSYLFYIGNEPDKWVYPQVKNAMIVLKQLINCENLEAYGIKKTRKIEGYVRELYWLNAPIDSLIEQLSIIKI